jgi:hypothetical protein
MNRRDRVLTKAGEPVDEARPGKYYLPFVAASWQHYIVQIIDHSGIIEAS